LHGESKPEDNGATRSYRGEIPLMRMNGRQPPWRESRGCQSRTRETSSDVTGYETVGGGVGGGGKVTAPVSASKRFPKRGSSIGM